MAAADACVERCNRSASTRGAKISHHAWLPRCARAVSQSCGDHHKKPSRHARYRYFAPARGVQCRGGQRFSDVSRSYVAASPRTAHDLAAGSARRHRTTSCSKNSSWRNGCANYSGTHGSRGSEDPGCVRKSGRAVCRLHDYSPAVGGCATVRALAGGTFSRPQREGAAADPAFAGKPTEQLSVAHSHDRRRNFCRADRVAIQGRLSSSRYRRAADTFVRIISPLNNSATPLWLTLASATHDRARCFASDLR